MAEKPSLLEEAASVVAENDREKASELNWLKNSARLDSTKPLLKNDGKKNFDVGDQPHAGLRSVIRRVIESRLH